MAGTGVYPLDIGKDVSAERLKKYFLKEDNQYRIKPNLRKMAIFAQHDLVKNPPYRNMHFISCRNLLIYMVPVLQNKIFSMLLFGLKMDGYLFLGSSENPMPIIQNLEVINKQYKLYRNVKSKRIVSFDAFSMPDSLELRTKSTYAVNEQVNNDPLQSITEMMQANLADQQDYLVVCVDENKEVIKCYGETSKYLLPKLFTSNLEELLPKKLGMVFNTLRSSVIKTNEMARLNGIKIKIDSVMISK